MAAPRSIAKDKLFNTRASSSSAMVNQKNLGSNSFQSVGTNIHPRNSQMGVTFKRRRIDKSEGVKFPSSEEAIKQKSDTKAVTKVTHGNQGFSTNSPGPFPSISKCTKILGKIVTSPSTETTNSLPLRGMKTCTMQQQAVEMPNLLTGEEQPPGFPSKKSAIGSVPITKGVVNRLGEPVALAAHAEPRGNIYGKKVGSIPRTGSVQGGQADAKILSEKVETSRLSENSASGSVTAPLLHVKPSPIGSSGKSINFPSGSNSGCNTVHERSLQNISNKSQGQHFCGPALKVIWKGNFEVNFSPDKRFYEGFLAHLSVKISRKAYQFARKIAGVLQFSVYPRCAFWPEIFQSDCPDANDIALFFYPGEIERSRQHYSKLLKYIEKRDLMLRSRMGHVELLVFPSKLLHEASQTLDGSCFMWGVFRCLKGKKVAKDAETLLSLPTVL